jgi:hypothetical protein
MKFLFATLFVLCASVTVAGETLVPMPSADPKSHRDLRAQKHDIRSTARVEQASAKRRFKAQRAERRAKELRAENATAAAELGAK